MVVAIDLTRRGSKRHEAVAAMAKEVYQDALGVAPTSIPPLLIAAFAKETPIGCVGIWGGDTDDREFLTEMYCRAAGLDMAGLYAQAGVRSRAEVVEVGCLCMQKAYRAQYTAILLGYTLEYIHGGLGAKQILIIRGRNIIPALREIGIQSVDLCSPNLDYYHGTDEERGRWRDKYFRVLRPVCAMIDVGASYAELLKRQGARKDSGLPHIIGGGLSPWVSAS